LKKLPPWTPRKNFSLEEGKGGKGDRRKNLKKRGQAKKFMNDENAWKRR
jgi:hypothetical protein